MFDFFYYTLSQVLKKEKKYIKRKSLVEYLIIIILGGLLFKVRPVGKVGYREDILLPHTDTLELYHCGFSSCSQKVRNILFAHLVIVYLNFS